MIALRSSAETSRAPRVAVILAAGNGSRMAGRDPRPKPLVKVLGMRLIERAILVLSQAGIARFVVVLGAQADVIEAELRRLPRLRGVAIETVRCPDWEQGNGHSLGSGAAAAGEGFLLAMADHVLAPALVERLLAQAVADPASLHLATDTDIPGVFDLDDATKVRTEGDRIVAIGKELADYDCIDTGLFACPGWFVAAVPAAVAAGASSVSAVMQRAIERGAMRSCPIAPHVWQDVDTPAMRREAERRLLAATRKPTDGPVSRLLNRPISLATTRFLARAGVTPNLVTTAVLLVGLVAAALMTGTSWRALALAGLLTQLASIWDGCDGELARVTLRSSRFGAWYDTLTDNLRYTAMVVACGIGLYRRDGALFWLGLAALFLIAALYLVAVMIRYLRAAGAPGTHLVVLRRVEEATAELAAQPLSRLLLRLRALVKQDVLALLAAILLLLGRPELVLACGLLAVFSMIVVVRRVVAPSPALAPATATAVWRRSRAWLGIAGLLLLAYLLGRAPLDRIGAALSGMGWAALLALPVASIWIVANTTGLYLLLGGRVRWWTLLQNRLIGDGYNATLPLAGLGGEPVRAAHLARYLPLAEAISAVVDDRVINLASGLLFSVGCLGVALGAIELPPPFGSVLVGYAASALLVAILVLVAIGRRLPDSAVAALGRWLGWREGGGGAPLPPRTLAATLACNLIGRSASLLEVALFLHLLEVPVSLPALFFISGILSGVGIVFFVVPQSIGVAEAAALYSFRVLREAEPLGLAFGLARRGRMLFFAALGVALHQILLARRRDSGGAPLRVAGDAIGGGAGDQGDRGRDERRDRHAG
jgi:1L-myo-inositol 1-phosphate cytidylyltransferase / CDP-L-myo-inositol myo-inositolphosphotransferase